MLSERDAENRRVWSLGPTRRADERLRTFPRRVGDAMMCGRCDGDGVVLTLGNRSADVIRKCTRCGGEGLEPPE